LLIDSSLQIYVHRSGRTARAHADGLTLLLVSPEDRRPFQKILTALSKDFDDIRDFPIDTSIMMNVRRRVAVARELDKLLHSKIDVSPKNENNNKRKKKSIVSSINQPVSLSVIEFSRFAVTMQKTSTNWFIKAAKECDLDLDDEMFVLSFSFQFDPIQPDSNTVQTSTGSPIRTIRRSERMHAERHRSSLSNNSWTKCSAPNSCLAV